jgi:hypothetical protein
MPATIEELYNAEVNDPESDVNAHMVTLRKYASKCKHITEFGVRGGGSTKAFLAAKPRRLVSYDLDLFPEILKLAESVPEETTFKFCHQNVLTTEIEPTDLLFIDTLHTYEQLREELRLHANKVVNWIILHDTEACGSIGEDGGKGLNDAISEFLEEGHFQIKEHFTNCNGLTVLERVSYADNKNGKPAPTPPQLVKKLRKQIIVRATPTQGMVSCWWAHATEHLVWAMNRPKASMFWKDWVGGEIAEGRNALVTMALDSETEDREVSHILWIDDDVIPMRGVLHQLLAHDREIAAGVYFTKEGPPYTTMPFFSGSGSGTYKFEPDKVYEGFTCCMGLTLVKTSLYTRMRDELKLPLDKYGHPQWYKTVQEIPDIEHDNGLVWMGCTEDIYFCKLAHLLGVYPLIDTSRHSFGFHYDKASGFGYPFDQWHQWTNNEPIRWPTPDGEVVWD